MDVANEEQLAILKQGVDVWNKWRKDNRGVEIDLRKTNLSEANLSEANLFRANLRGSDLTGAILNGANLSFAKLAGANLSDAKLIGTRLSNAKLRYAAIRNADLTSVNFFNADLSGADLSGANLNSVNLERTEFIKTKIQDTIFKDCRIYGISVWDPQGTPINKACDFIITPQGDAEVTVENLKVAQFVYILLNNEEIRDVLDTIGKKGVLILGRFTPERKKVLDVLRDKLRTLNFVPMMFDFEGATTKDFTETIKILAGMCRFIIADITSPKAIPTELQATVPDYKVPFVPIIQEGEEPFAMFANLQDYPWMFDVLQYRDSDQLIAVIDKAIIQPALIKADELNVQKAEDVRKRHAKDYL